MRGIVVDGNNDLVAGSYNGTLIRFNDSSAREMAYPPNEYGSFSVPISRNSRMTCFWWEPAKC